MTSGVTRYRFGPFTLDVAAYRLIRDDVDVAVSPRLIDLLRHLVERPSALASKEELFAAIWPDVIVSDNALTQAISDLRQVLGDSASRPVYVQTVARRGYRFIGDVTPVEAASGTGGEAASVGHVVQTEGRDTPGGSGGTGLASPFALRSGRRARESSSLEATRAFLEGRWRLEALDADLVPEAIDNFQRAVEHDPSFSAAYVGLANALFWAYEASRDFNSPDTALLRRSVDAARQAMALDPDLPDAHATLAFILVSANRIEEARIAGRRAVALDPSYWAHHFRLGHAAWGDERLRAHGEALALYPDFAFAHFQIAMVHIARGELALAEQTLRQGIVVRERHQQSSERFPARGLHWLLGLVLLARGDDAQASRQFERELASAGGQLYAREFSIAAHNGLGLIALKKCDSAGAGVGAGAGAAAAADRFRQALARYDGHARSHFGLAAALAASGDSDTAESELAKGREAAEALAKSGRVAESVLALAMGDVLSGEAEVACGRLAALLENAPPGFAGWTIPVEPAFAGLHERGDFQKVLKMLAMRAA